MNSEMLRATSNVIRTVYVINKLAVAFSSHSPIVTLQKLNGVKMGVHHYDRKGATRMTESISNNMHKTLIQSLIQNDAPISLMDRPAVVV